MIVFLHIQKTGGTTFQSILQKNFGASCCHSDQTRRDLFSHADLKFVKKFYPRLRAITGHNINDPLQYSIPDPFYGTFLREPIARTISSYQASVLLGTNRASFEDSLKNRKGLNNHQVHFMAGEANLDKAKRFLERCHFIGFTEKFNLSLKLFEKLAPCPLNVNYKRLNSAKNNQIQTDLNADPRMVELARNHNRLDLELYDFALSEIFPKLCQKAGINPAEKVPSYEVAEDNQRLNLLWGRFYNKVFRQIYKVGHKIYYPTDADLAVVKTEDDPN